MESDGAIGLATLSLDCEECAARIHLVSERAALFTAKDAPPSRRIEESSNSPGKTLLDSSFRSAKARVINHFERNYLEGVLQSCEGNITHAAVVARKNRRAFFQLLRKHRIQAGRFRPL